MRILLASLAIAALLPGLASARCVAPTVPLVPDGATATQTEMLAARHAFLAYHAAVQVYLDCASPAGIPVVSQEAVLRTLRTTADRFNKELRAFKHRGVS